MKKRNFNWDGCNSPVEILIRRMLLDHPCSVLKDHSKEELRTVFLKNIHRFKRENRTFWKLILEVSDEEINRAAKKNFRTACDIWPY